MHIGCADIVDQEQIEIVRQLETARAGCLILTGIVNPKHAFVEIYDMPPVRKQRRPVVEGIAKSKMHHAGSGSVVGGEKASIVIRPVPNAIPVFPRSLHGQVHHNACIVVRFVLGVDIRAARSV